MAEKFMTKREFFEILDEDEPEVLKQVWSTVKDDLGDYTVAGKRVSEWVESITKCADQDDRSATVLVEEILAGENGDELYKAYVTQAEKEGVIDKDIAERYRNGEKKKPEPTEPVHEIARKIGYNAHDIEAKLIGIIARHEHGVSADALTATYNEEHNDNLPKQKVFRRIAEIRRQLDLHVSDLELELESDTQKGYRFKKIQPMIREDGENKQLFELMTQARGNLDVKATMSKGTITLDVSGKLRIKKGEPGYLKALPYMLEQEYDLKREDLLRLAEEMQNGD